MNERIRELGLQADIKFETHPQHQGVDTAVIIPTDLEKFAELIVADCIRIVEGYCETSPEIYGLPLEILEHFDMELNND